MKTYYNLPNKQWGVQLLVDKFNADETLWRSLCKIRMQRRKGKPQLKQKCLQAFDLLMFSALRPPDDCISKTTR